MYELENFTLLLFLQINIRLKVEDIGLKTYFLGKGFNTKLIFYYLFFFFFDINYLVCEKKKKTFCIDWRM